jgi:hypothetical protein
MTSSFDLGVVDGMEKVAIIGEIDKELHDPRLYSNVRGFFDSRKDRVKAHKKLTKGTAPTRAQAASEGWNRRKRKKS